MLKEARNVKKILNTYFNDFGQLINWNKSLVFFIKTSMDRQRKMASILCCGIGSLPSTYLGLPLGSKSLEAF